VGELFSLSAKKEREVTVMTKQCESCGKSFVTNVAGSVCPQCLQRKTEYAEFEAHIYTRAELMDVDLRCYIPAYAKWGFVKAFVFIVLIILGGVVGAAVGGRFGCGIGIFLGISSGIAVATLAWRHKDEKFPILKARLDAMFTIGAMVGGFIGTFGALGTIGSAGYLNIKYGLMPLLPAVVFGALLAVCGGLLTIIISGKKIKQDLIASFDEWEKEKSR
jgi:hypothetical protein